MTSHTSLPSDSQQLLHAAQQERDQAQASAKRWRRLYETEAQQRQQEAQIAEQTIQSLRAEIQQLCQFSSGPQVSLPPSGQGAVVMSNSVPHLHNQLADLVAERDQLLQALEQEQNNHAKTRENLISALGDALDAQKPQQSSALSSSPRARAGAIIRKDRNGRKET